MPPLALLLLVAAVGLPALWLVRTYNALVRDRNQVQNSWRQIDVQLARRHDLIPNLVDAVRGAMQFERDTLEAVVAARGRAVETARGRPGVAETAAAESQLSTALGRLVALVESHPQLGSLTNVAALQEELRSTENRIAFARQLYNDSAARYNTRQQVIPAALLARLAAAEPAPLWEAPDDAHRVPTVDLTTRPAPVA
jgi:LemA protein